MEIILREKTITLKIKDYEDIYKVIKSLKVKSLWNTISIMIKN